jgi:hypothetical protein
MAGTGKGPLRIAIEDWFETTLLGKYFAKIWGEASHDIEQGVYKQYKGVIDQIHKITGTDYLLNLRTTAGGQPLSQGGLTEFLGFASGLGSSAASSFLAPIGRIINYDADMLVKSARFDVGSMLVASRRAPEFADSFKLDYRDLGWSDERLSAWYKMAENLLASSDYIMAWRRGLITETVLNDMLYKLMFRIEDIPTLKELSKVIPGVQDLISMQVREAWDEGASAKYGYDLGDHAQLDVWAAKQGLDPDWIKRYWRSHWRLPEAQMGYEMLHRLRPGKTSVPFGTDDMRELLRVLDYPVYWRDRLIEISYYPYTRVDVRRMYGQGVLSADEVYQAYLDLGYDADHAKHLSDFAVAYEDDQGNAKTTEIENLSKALYKSQYLKGVINRDQYRAALVKLGESTVIIELLLDQADLQLKDDLTPDNLKSYRTDLENVILKAYVLRMLSVAEATSMLTDVKLQPDQIQLALMIADLKYSYDQRNAVIKLAGDAYINHTYTRSEMISQLNTINIPTEQQTQIMAEFDTIRNIRSNRLTQSQYLAAYKAKIITQDDYKDALAGLGYPDRDITILVALAAPQPII